MEFREIIKDKNLLELTYIYDSNVSPKTLGDFFLIAFLIRILSQKGKKVRFIYVLDYKSNDSKDGLAEEHRKIYETLLISFNYKVEFISANEYIKNKNKFYNIIFKRYIKKDLPIYCFTYELICRFYNYFYDVNNKNFFLNETDLLTNKLVEKPFNGDKFIAWPCRYNKEYGHKRDLLRSEFILIRNLIKDIFPSIPILIISNVKGCNYYKDMEPNDGYQLYYSKDFFPKDSYLIDSYFLLCSSLIIMLRCGGISTPSLFSKIPYYITALNGCSSITSNDKLTPWSMLNKHQFFYSSEKLNKRQFKKFLKEIKIP